MNNGTSAYSLLLREYPDSALVSLCPECHSVETELSNRYGNRLRLAMAKRNYTWADTVRLCELIEDTSKEQFLYPNSYKHAGKIRTFKQLVDDIFQEGEY